MFFTFLITSIGSGVQPFRDWPKKRDWHLSLELIFKILHIISSSDHHKQQYNSRIFDLFIFIVYTDDLLAKIMLI